MEQTLEFPIQLVHTDEGILITLPINLESTNNVQRELYATLENYLAQIQSKKGFKASLTKEGFPTLNITTRARSRYNLKEGVEKAFYDIARKANLNISIFETTLYPSKIEREDDQTLKSFKAFVVSRIKELGYPNVAAFCREKEFSRNTLNSLFMGHSKGGRGSKKALAKALRVHLSELEL